MSVSALDAKPAATAERTEFYERLRTKNAAPLWEVLAQVVPPRPRTPFVPAVWRYDEMRPLVMESGGLITAEEAERRVIILENPGAPGMSQITGSLYAGLQLVLPGEVAPSHHHMASALRFVIESDGGYTAVDGEKQTMRPGDFILTPSWEFHDHGNNTDQPVVWMDVLDLPLVNLLGCSFAEHHPDATQYAEREEGTAEASFAGNLFPVDYQQRSLNSPILNYSFEHSRESLAKFARFSDPHPCHGIKMRYVNPATGGFAMHTIGTFLQLLPKGFAGKPYRFTDATIFYVMEGRGRTRIGEETIGWGPRDIFVAPSWYPVAHFPEGEAVLFSASDRPVQKMLGWWREQAPSE